MSIQTGYTVYYLGFSFTAHFIVGKILHNLSRCVYVQSVNQKNCQDTFKLKYQRYSKNNYLLLFITLHVKLVQYIKRAVQKWFVVSI